MNLCRLAAVITSVMSPTCDRGTISYEAHWWPIYCHITYPVKVESFLFFLFFVFIMYHAPVGYACFAFVLSCNHLHSCGITYVTAPVCNVRYYAHSQCMLPRSITQMGGVVGLSCGDTDNVVEGGCRVVEGRRHFGCERHQPVRLTTWPSQLLKTRDPAAVVVARCRSLPCVPAREENSGDVSMVEAIHSLLMRVLNRSHGERSKS